MTDVFNDHFSIVYDICRAACHGDTALGRSSVKKLAGLMESSTPDDAALLKRLTKKAAKDPAHFVQSDGGSSKATISHVGEDAALPAEKVAAEPKDWRVGMFFSSSNPRKQVRVLADGHAQIAEYEKHHSFVRWIDDAAPQQPAQSAEQDDLEALDWLETEVSAVDTWYRGDPSYEHEAYWMKLKVLKLIAEAKTIFDRAASTQSTATQPAQTQVALTDDARECLADVVSHYRALYAGLAFQLNEATVTENADDMAYWKHEIKTLERMYAQAERALLAVQPVSGGKS